MQVDIDLIALCIKKDRKALFELYKLCYVDLMRICLRYTNAKEDAEDYMSTGFLKIIDNLQKYSLDKTFEPWAKKVMLHHVIDMYRQNKKYNENIILETTRETILESTKNEAEKKYDTEELYLLVSQLPNMTKQVFNLYVVDGYSHKEIGELLEISEGTSKWHLNNARQKLQEKLNNKPQKKTRYEQTI